MADLCTINASPRSFKPVSLQKCVIALYTYMQAGTECGGARIWFRTRHKKPKWLQPLSPVVWNVRSWLGNKALQNMTLINYWWSFNGEANMVFGLCLLVFFSKTFVHCYRDILFCQHSYSTNQYSKHGMEPVKNNTFKSHVVAARGVSNHLRASDGVLSLS